MDTKIIGQGYNIDADTSVAKELIEQFNSKRYDSFYMSCCFCKLRRNNSIDSIHSCRKGKRCKD